ncbi:Ankyrin repeat protein 1 [Giardia muris]|uniref:Ankyrin repeat protein 1 n=1 Tax=Giardia muris TaxID=5742 RepID=A0A4Z1T6A0_GIAMU|nr:Ankyrin repeat protein 1 [Giardia muris]|eukprot:TNJ28059.1 Ankyrin repeat protein 1 [Giardia muris]
MVRSRFIDRADDPREATYAPGARSHDSTGRSTLLIDAAIKGDVEGIMANIHLAGQRDALGETALMKAAIYGRAKCVSILLDKEAGIQRSDGWTALMCAAANGHHECVSLLLKDEVRMVDSCGVTALMRATTHGCTRSVLLLLYEASMQTTRVSEWPFGCMHAQITALMLAAALGNVSIIRMLVPYELGLCSIYGHMAFWYAEYNAIDSCNRFIFGGHRAAMKLLAIERTKSVHVRRPPPPPTEVLDDQASRRNKNSLQITSDLMRVASIGNPYSISYHIRDLMQQTPEGVTALMHAVYGGWEGCILPLLRETCLRLSETISLPNKVRINKDGTALMLAAALGRTKIIEYLQALQPGMTDVFGLTALMYATLYGQHSCVKPLLAETGNRTLAEVILPQGAERCTMSIGSTALMMAVASGHIRIARLLIPYELGLMTASGSSALMLAAYYNVVTIIPNLIFEAGRCTLEQTYWGDQSFPSGITALMLAAQRGHLQAAKALIPYELGLMDSSGSSAYTYSLQAQDANMTRLLVAEQSGCFSLKENETQLIAAARRGLVLLVKHYLHQAGAIDDSGMSALMYSIQNGDLQCVSLLAELEVNILGPTGETALYSAMSQYHLDLARVIGRYDTQCSSLLYYILNDEIDNALTVLEQATQTYHQYSALMLAAASGHSNLIGKLLYREGRLQTREGETALMLASRFAQWKTAYLLLDKEGGLQTKTGCTALMIAASKESCDCLQQLAEKEAGLRNNKGETALMLATRSGNSTMVKVLVNYEAGIQDIEGWSALMIAATTGHLECARILSNHEARRLASNGTCALRLALERKHISIVKLLLPLEYPLISNNIGALETISQTVFHTNVRESSLLRAAIHDDIPMLLAELKNVRSRDECGWTALMHASKKGHTNVVRILVGYETRLTLPDGMTALMLSVVHGATDCVEILASRELLMQTQDGLTALMLAVLHNRVDCLRFLVGEAHLKTKRAGQTVGCTFPAGLSALDLAYQLDHCDVINKLVQLASSPRGDEPPRKQIGRSIR